MGSTARSFSVQPVADNLDYSRARHLLDRCTFGATKSEVDAMVGKSVTAALGILIQDRPEPAPPVSYDPKDLDVPAGQTWINASYNNTYNPFRIRSLRAWWIGLMMQQPTSLVEKMTLFWHNHFVTETDVVNNAGLCYQYVRLLRKHALGNVKQLVAEMTVNPAMLIYLNGESNRASAPNENYGRELFELFTIGKGPLAGEGNYTNYTEADIREAAKVLTGWTVNRNAGTASFDTSRHDKTTKVFSAAFAGTNIANKEAEEYKALIDMIFSRKETARYLARKIYRWFMYYQVDQTVEAQIIEPLATTLYNGNYEIRPLLEQLLGSEHFFSTDYAGSQIKNPLDFTVGVFRKCAVPLSGNILVNYEAWNEIFNSCKNMEMALGDPPDVAGWPQYYKEPSFYELWVNSATVPMRTSFSDTMCTTGLTKSGFSFVADPFALAGKVSNPQEVSGLVNGLAQILLPVPLSTEQVQQLKEELIPGLPESTWTFEWNKYTANPGDAAQKALIANKLKALLKAMMRLPAFYLA